MQVYVLITEETLEEKLLSTLSAKHQLALAALDILSITLPDRAALDNLSRSIARLLALGGAPLD